MKYSYRRELRKYKRKHKMRTMPKPVFFLLGVFEFLLSLSIIAAALLFIPFMKSGADIFSVTSFLSKFAVGTWNNITDLQKLIVAISGIVMLFSLLRMCFSFEKEFWALWAYISVFYGCMLFLSAGKNILVGKDAFILMVAIGEIVIILSDIFINGETLKVSLGHVAVQLAFIIPGMILSYLVGMTIMNGPHADGTPVHLLLIQLLFTIIMLVFQIIIIHGFEGSGYSGNHDPLNDMTGDEESFDFDGSVDVSDV